MIEVVSEHSVDLSLLPDSATILDCGCRGFGFTNYFRSKGHRVLAIDIDKLDGDYLRVGIGHANGKAAVSEHLDPQARKLTPYDPSKESVDVYTLTNLERIYGQKFDLIKLDVEGEEQSILRTASHPIAKQVSVEFHAHCTSETKETIDDLLSWLGRWYTIYNKVWESRHGAGFNYWDILLIAK
jgi:hypothetical protein